MQGEASRGLLFALGAFGLWGVLPLYLHALNHWAPSEILAHRITWTVVTVGLVVLATGRGRAVFRLLANRRTGLMLGLSSLLIGVNWLVFVYAVAANNVLEASLGYFINPLISVALGFLVLRERLSPLQWAAVIVAAIAVLIKTVEIGTVPWISLSLAVSFGLYGLVRKVIAVPSLDGLFLEALIFVPAVLPLLLLTGLVDGWRLDSAGADQVALLFGLGVMTAVPLVLFAAGATRLPLSTLGLTQYLAPSLQFLMAIFLFHETVTGGSLIAFGLIWLALAIYTVDMFRGRKAD